MNIEKTHKIAFFLPHPIHYILGLIRALQKEHSIETTVFFGSDYGLKLINDPSFNKSVKWYDKTILDGIPCVFLKNFSFLKSSKIGKFFGIINFGILKEIRRGRYDALVIHGYTYVSNWLAFFIAKLTKTPVFFRGEIAISHDRFRSKKRLFFKKIILKKILFRWFIDSFLYIGEENKKFYEVYGVSRNKLFFVPYAIDNDNFIKKDDKGFLKSKIRKELLISTETPIILYLGKLIKGKRPLDVLRAYEMIKEKNKALIFVGDGPLLPELKRYVNEKKINNVFFVGFKGQNEIAKYYAAADVFVHPSASETWGLVINEAMCFSLPVVVSNMVGCGLDLVKNGENGYIFPVGDIEKITEYLEKLIKNVKQRIDFGKKSLEIIKNYSYKKGVENILKALNKN